MGTLRSHNNFFEADHLSLSKPLKTLNIRRLNKHVNARSTRTCCSHLQ